jgi:hypothetical protein
VYRIDKNGWTLLKAKNGFSTDTLVTVTANKNADNFVTSDNAVLRFEAIKYLSGSEILLYKNSLNK